MTWCWLSRPCVVFLACVHLALFLALFLSPGSSLVSSWCDHSMLASSLWQCLAVPSLLQLCWEPTHLFSLLSTKHTESFSDLSSQRPQDVFLHSSWVWVRLRVCHAIISPRAQFLANVNSHSRWLIAVARPSVICLSVTLVRPTQAVEIFRNISTAFGSLAICWHPQKILRRSSWRNPSAGWVKHEG